MLIDSSMRSKLDLSTSAGSITVNTTNATAFDQMSLNAKTGEVKMMVAPGSPSTETYRCRPTSAHRCSIGRTRR